MTSPEPTPKPTWNPYLRVQEQLCRYYPNDERDAPARKFAVNGPMLRLALVHAKRGFFVRWRGSNAPASIREIVDAVADGSVTRCEAFADFEIADDDDSPERFCFWILWTSVGSFQFLSPTHRELQKLRAEEIHRNEIARAAKKSKLPARTLAQRRDVL